MTTILGESAIAGNWVTFGRGCHTIVTRFRLFPVRKLFSLRFAQLVVGAPLRRLRGGALITLGPFNRTRFGGSCNAEKAEQTGAAKGEL